MTTKERQISRIGKMEADLNALTAANEGLRCALEEFDKAHARAVALSGYLGSENWWRDVEADQSGALPEDLKRGVLSEDGIYNALDDYRDLLTCLLKTVEKSIRKG